MSLFLGTGLFSGQRADGTDQPWVAIYDDLLALFEEAERLGYDTAWVTEHHFTTDGYLSAALAVLAAAAARTSRIRLGTNVLLAPLHHPMRLAEDAAAVDVLSHGRLILGLGIGYRDEEFDVLGVSKRDRVPLMAEIVATCRGAWTGEKFAFRGRDVICRPVPPGPPPLWLGAWVDAGVRRAGRLGDGFIAPSGGLEALRHLESVLDEAAEVAGRRGPMPFCAPAAVYLSNSGQPSPALERGARHLMVNYGAWYSSSSDVGGGRSVGEKIQARADRPMAGILCGSPDQIVEALAPTVVYFAPRRDFHLVLRHHWPGMDRTEAMEQMQRFTEEVAPALHRL